MTETQLGNRNSRSLKNLRFMAGAKLRILFAVMTIGMFVSTFLLWGVMATINGRLQRLQDTDPALAALAAQIQGAVSGAIGVGIIFNLASAMMALLFGLMIGHRFYGPVVPLERHLKELQEGKYASRVKLREGDELLELMKAQNDLADTLEKKFP